MVDLGLDIAGVLEGGVRAADTRWVFGERLWLPGVAPDRWMAGVAPRGVRCESRGQDTVPAAGALDVSTLTVRRGEAVLGRGEEYLVDEAWGVLGSAEQGGEEVTLDYRYSLLRVDSVVRREGGGLSIVEGRSDLTCPVPPSVPAGRELVANVFVPYFGDGETYEIFPVTEGRSPRSPAQLELLGATTRRREGGAPLRVVCWGDSVTDGGDASSPQTEYPNVLERRLRSGGVTVEVAAVAVGGSTTADWLDDGKRPECDWKRVERQRPDLITLEFVNDANLDPGRWPMLYGEVLARSRALGADLLITTPHFTMATLMGGEGPAGSDNRPYTRFLRAFCQEHGLALADVSRRWEHLRVEGLPYQTLLRNGINHPDDRGHALVADEIAACLGA